MSDIGPPDPAQPRNNLRSLVVSERLEMYREAGNSPHTDIRAHILKNIDLDAEHLRAEDALLSAHRRKQEKRLSPSVALLVCLGVWAAAAAVSIYAWRNLPNPLPMEVTDVSAFSAFVVSAIALLLSRTLNVSEFFEMLRHGFNFFNPFKKGGRDASGQSTGVPELPAPDDDAPRLS